MYSIGAGSFLRGLTAAALGLAISAGAGLAQQKSGNERYIPTIWVDPDGCEHWVMDDGFEGYMTPHVKRNGKPVCRSGNLCGVVGSDELFESNSASISSEGRARLRKLFSQQKARAFSITGHTDSQASDGYNIGLSQRRANAVAQIARASGATVTSVRGIGEREPRASNKTKAGMAKNRRVEIRCIR